MHSDLRSLVANTPTPSLGKVKVQAWWNSSSGLTAKLTEPSTVRFAGAIYVLHAFQKKSPSGIKTDRRDVDLVHERLKRAKADYEEMTKLKPQTEGKTK